jgi:hypothetical protein
MITIKVSGSFAKTEQYLSKLKAAQFFNILEKYGSIGVSILGSATPVDSGLTAQSWTYEVKQRPGYFSIIWKNTNLVDGIPVAVMLQYGHGTGTGGYVKGRDYINPVIQPLFDRMMSDLEREVKSL